MNSDNAIEYSKAMKDIRNKHSIVVENNNTLVQKHILSHSDEESSPSESKMSAEEYEKTITRLEEELRVAQERLEEERNNPKSNATCSVPKCENQAPLQAPTSTYEKLKYTTNYYRKARGYFCPNGCLSLDEQPKSGRGVYFQAYGSNKLTVDTYFQEVYEAAKMIKSMSHIPVAVATNHVLTEEEEKYFDHIIKIPDIHLFKGSSNGFYKGMERQYITRIMYYAATPFQTTITFDATVRFCDKDALSEILEEFGNSNVDFSVSNRNNGQFFPSTWFILFNWNDRTKLLLRDWLHELLTGRYYLDEQQPLLRALVKATVDDRIVFKRLSNNWAFTPRCYDKHGKGDVGCASMVGIPLTGRIRAIHGYDNTYCELLNSEEALSQNPHAYCLNVLENHDVIKNNVFISGEGHKIVHSQEELAKCLHGMEAPKLNWDITLRPSTGLFWEDCSLKKFKSDNKRWCGLN